MKIGLKGINLAKYVSSSINYERFIGFNGNSAKRCIILQLVFQPISEIEIEMVNDLSKYWSPETPGRLFVVAHKIILDH